MAVTCSFKRKLGKIAMTGSVEGSVCPCDVWSGGNCLLVATYGEAKNLAFFISDTDHLKNLAKHGWFKDYIRGKATISADLGHYIDLCKILAEAGVQVTITPKGKKIK